MDKAPAYGAGDSEFESQYRLLFCFCSKELQDMVKMEFKSQYRLFFSLCSKELQDMVKMEQCVLNVKANEGGSG